MKSIIGPDNRVNYGVFDEPVNFNSEDFRLWNFFGKEIGGFRKRWAFHAFNYLGISFGDYFVGFAAVRLGYLNTVFAYVYQFGKGLVAQYDAKNPGNMFLDLPANPDEYAIKFKKGGSFLNLSKSHANKTLSAEANFSGKLAVSLSARYGLDVQTPLRVLNPSEPFRFTFTEKAAPILCDAISVKLNGKELVEDPSQVTILYDWSGGYLRRETNWYWAAFSGFGKNPSGAEIPVGANFAALTNEAFFSENAFWAGVGKRSRVSRVIFEFSAQEPYKPWHLWDEAGTVDLTFTPLGERSEKVNAVLLKTWFRQFFGSYSGTLTPPGGEPVKLDNVHGVSEFHRALW
ncbi:MAG: DUF2804 domain-containing protein [Deltaproteobacteria bacterium]|nr:DUF2804 domain-containing protein [Deltaproteobacteria bacterium]